MHFSMSLMPTGVGCLVYSQHCESEMMPYIDISTSGYVHISFLTCKFSVQRRFKLLRVMAVHMGVHFFRLQIYKNIQIIFILFFYY